MKSFGSVSVDMEHEMIEMDSKLIRKHEKKLTCKRQITENGIKIRLTMHLIRLEWELFVLFENEINMNVCEMNDETPCRHTLYRNYD